jgi:hypothetical protein
MATSAEVCGDEFIAAMRARLAAEDPALAANVDQDGVRKNLIALGGAVSGIIEQHSVSDTTADAVYWRWVADVTAWLTGLHAWQLAVASAFTAWSPATTVDQALKAQLVAAPDPGTPPSPPTSLRTRIVP